MSSNWSTYQGGAARNGQSSSGQLNPAPAGQTLTQPNGQAIVAAPSFGADGTIYCASVDGTITARPSRDSNPTWSYAGAADPSGLTVGADGTLYYGNSGGITALNADGTLKWNYSIPGLAGAKGGCVVTDTGLVCGYLLAPSSSTPGAVVSINSSGRACTTVYTSLVPNGSPPSFFNGMLVYAMAGGKLYAIDPSRGIQMWLIQGTAGISITGSPAIGPNGTVYVGLSTSSGGQLAAYSPAGALLWNCPLGQPLLAGATPAISNDGSMVFICASAVFAVETATGRILWQGGPAGAFGSPALTSDGILYTAVQSGYDFSRMNAATGSDGRNSVMGTPASSGELSIGLDRSLYVPQLDGSVKVFWGVPAAAPADLYYGVSYPPSIQRITGQSIATLSPAAFTPSGLAVDGSSDEVYWTNGPSILKAPAGGGSPVEVASGLDFNPAGLALDLPNGQILCCDSTGGAVRAVALADGTVSTIVSGLKMPVSVAVDTVHNLLFLVEYSGGLIRRAGLDGSNMVVVADDVSLPQSVVVDTSASRVYWAGKTLIEACDYDGGNRGTVATLAVAQPSSNSRKLAIDTVNKILYWTDQATQSIQQVSFEGNNAATLVSKATNPAFANPTVLALA